MVAALVLLTFVVGYMVLQVLMSIAWVVTLWGVPQSVTEDMARAHETALWPFADWRIQLVTGTALMVLVTGMAVTAIGRAWIAVVWAVRGASFRLLCMLALVVLVILLASCDNQDSTPAPTAPAAPTTASTASTTSKTSVTPHFEEAATCPWNLSGISGQLAGMSVKCGYVAVPEHHGQPDGPQLRLAVVVAQVDPARPSPDAIIYLNGGPGNRSDASLLSNFAQAGRDIIVYDQRGVGYSIPALNCPAAGNRDPVSAVYDTATALVTCRDQLVQAGAHLDAYTIPESAADVNDIRQALGYAQLDLYGLSYGTKLSLAVLRDFPLTVRSVVLDSVLPMQASVVTDLPGHIERTLNLAFATCAQDAECNWTYPELQQVYYQLVAQLDAHPATVPTRAGSVSFTGTNLTRLLLALLLQGPQRFPDLIYQLKSADYSSLGQFLDETQAPSSDTAWVMSFSVACSDGEYGTQEEAAGAIAQVTPALRTPL